MDAHHHTARSAPGSGMGQVADTLLHMGPRRGLLLATTLAVVLSLALTLAAHAIAGNLPDLTALLIAALAPLIAVPMCFAPFMRLLQALEAMRLDLARLAQIDETTHAFNRRFFLQMAQREFDRARRYGHPLAVVMIEIADFAAILSRHGHNAGDASLRRLAGIALGGTRTLDVVARLEGARFALLLPETDAKAAAQVALRLAHELVSEPIQWAGGELVADARTGFAAIEAEDEALDTLLRRAERMQRAG
ncbi:diguanylate cyclase [Niveibacterium sp. 24ML]|uniref:GGDEF domain-containing protein n=1 Tax=Niveibacterium sp. 24ML TaxID=2985512 RepID=UPI00226E1CE8|nr:diguanylate cyclase [Niveibacterium sp. 24ML]MCX9155740.1 diguanylate cyclase [Niveibacterium sp. 24ML]